ncbi:hypothetical protein I317_06967 [Kwoniella heveanensis CBS 569]|nr:hypothetical protein I317_06967 [Kwoniella heveanensis CBS 569]
MVAVHKKPKFDPAAHLHKHGWKGKGTALKHGHSTRPLAVVQKKTLSGIGKDRDEAVPFWDHIFAATAASLFSPSASPASPAPSSSSSWAAAPVTVDSKGNKLAPAPGELTVQTKPKLSINATARAGKELARRGLYSRFLRGKVLVPDPESESESESEDADADADAGVDEGEDTPAASGIQTAEVIEAGPSNSKTTMKPSSSREPSVQVEDEKTKSKSKSKRKDKGKGKAKDGEDEEAETKEERRARKAERARRKAEKLSARSSVNPGEGADCSKVVDKKERKSKKRKAKDDVSGDRDASDNAMDNDEVAGKGGGAETGGKASKDKKEKRRKERTEAAAETEASDRVKNDKKEKKSSKRKLKEDQV